MKRFTSLQPVQGRREPAVTLGNFDGVHLGHQKIFRRLVERAQALGGESVVYTFQPHPFKVLYPDRFVPLITSYGERAELIEGFGIDVLICVPFDRAFAQIGAREFVETVLHKGLGAKEVLVGYDYAFGRGREGNQEFLREMGRELGFGVEVVPPVLLDGSVVSSSRIRTAIQEGEMTLAKRMLGREFAVEGTVQLGHHRGKNLGYPTANLALKSEMLPKSGVYAVRVSLPGQREPLGGMANLGTNPTFGDEQLSFEVHIFDFKADLYGEEMHVAFVDRLRDEKRFPSPDALVAQLRRDEELSRSVLQRQSP